MGDKYAPTEPSVHFKRAEPDRLWNCIYLIIRSRILVLVHKERTMKENSKLMSCIYNKLEYYEDNSNSERFGNLTPAMVAQRVRKIVRMDSTSSLVSFTWVFKVLA